MADSELQDYRRYVRDNLEKMIEVFAHISVDDFSTRIRLAGLKDDEFTRAFCGLDMMMDDLIEVHAKYARIKDQLEQQIRDRTAELAEANKKLRLDIEQLKTAEETLLNHEKFLAEVFISIQDPISVLDTDLNIVRVNAAMEAWYPQKMPLAGKKCYWVYHNRDKPCGVCPSLQALKTGKTSTEIVDKCDSLGNKIGWSEVNAFPWHDAQSGKLLGVIEHVRDISDRIRLESEFFKVKKLESLGVLAGGIAHDFNNILTGILSNIALAKAAMAEASEPHLLLSDAEKASLRAGKLVRQLLTFSKGGAPVKEPVSLNNLIEETIGFCLAGSKVNYRLDLANDLMRVEADRSQIDQVLNNLFINAVQAMPGGGTIAVTSENVEFNAPSLLTAPQLAELQEGRYAKITVRDEGAGIQRENLEKIFDPYFTTKETGTGLGLTIVYSIITRHKGAITVDSAPGKGTEFSLYLPGMPSAVEPTPKPPPVAGSVRGGRVLVVDDDVVVRDAMERMLAHAGFEPTGATKGEEAVALYAESIQKGNPFRFVILDLTIPGGMGGKEAVVHLLKINPAVKAVVASGYSHDPIMADFRKYGFSSAITKPFQLTDLIGALEMADAC